MKTAEELKLVEEQIDALPEALDPQEVADFLGCSRRYADILMDQGKLTYFTLDPTKTHKQRRVLRATIKDFVMRRINDPGFPPGDDLEAAQ